MLSAMDETTAPEPSDANPAADPAIGVTVPETDAAIDDELLLEEVSIDGMCGVY